MNDDMLRRVSKGKSSLWRSAGAEPLDGLTGDVENYPVDDFMRFLSGSRLRCAEVGQTLPGVPRGQSPLASLAEAEKAKAFFGGAVQSKSHIGASAEMWLARLRNLPN